MEYEGVGCVEVKKREQQTAEQNGILIPGLPFEIATLCIARVPRSNHLHMSGVSRAWRNLVHGKELSEVRCKLSLVEEWLYLWTIPKNELLCFDPLLCKWSKLPPMPDDNRIFGHFAFASFDEKFFVIGGYTLSLYSSDVAIPCKTVLYFDARSYSWHKAPDLNEARAECMVGIIDKKLYVFGGNIKGELHPTNTAEVYDPVMNSWKFVSCSRSPVNMFDSVVMGGKFYAFDCGGKGVVYDAQMDKWEDMPNELSRGWGFKSTFLNGKLYTLDDGFFEDPEVDWALRQMIRAYTPGKTDWEKVNAMSYEWHRDFTFGNVEFVSFGGKLCIVSGDTSFSGEGSRLAFIDMVILEVKESFEGPSFSVTFRDEFKLQSEEVSTFPWVVKHCQTIAL